MSDRRSDARVALFVAPGLEEIEGLTVVDLLFRAGIPCDTVAVAPSRQVTSSHEVTIVCDRALSDADFSFDDYDMLVLPGGMPGTRNLRASRPLCDALVAHHAAGLPVSAICAAPTVLADLGILRGRRACGFPGTEGQLERGGAVVTRDEVTVDGTVTTSRGMGTAIPFGLAIVARYLGEGRAEELARQVVFRSSPRG